MIATTIIDIIRHGEPEGGRKYRGHMDDPLSDKGWQQMRAAVAGRRDWEQIFTSPMRRCYDFATELGQQLKVPVTPIEQLKEISFGSWEGYRATELEASDPGIMARFRHDPLHQRPEGAEPLPDFIARIEQGWQQLCDQAQGQRVLLVGHAGQIRAVLHLLLQIPLSHLYRFNIANAAMLQVTQKPDYPPQVQFYT
ncbi:histidine phosphatase family protein [Ectothiorhodospiraceae bacterium BW-2]|nr:histidine phosphatase family protein [Ectothiorhodospiraceae bacterium BW-2]